MPPRGALVAFLFIGLSFVLLAFFLFSSSPNNARPSSPQVTSTSTLSTTQSKSQTAAWNGYNPLIRSKHSDDQKPGASQKSFLSRLFSWISKPFFGSFVREASPKLPETFHTANVAGVSVAFHNPFSAFEFKGVALLMHACRQSAVDWFVLPEHRKLAAELLRHRLALLAITSANRVTGCWSTRHPASVNLDAARVRLAIHQWLDAQRITHAAPIYAVGVSSGATFLSILSAAHIVPSLASQALYLSAGNPRALRNASRDYPSTLFIRLQGDRYYAPASLVAASRAVLLSRRVPLVAEMPLPSEHWTSMSLHLHEPRVSAAASDAIFQHLAICSQKIDCAAIRASSHNASAAEVWRQPELQIALSQVARVLRGEHELTAAHANLVADWLVRHGKRPLRTHSRRSRRRFL